MTDICVLGMSHLGCVTAAGFSSLKKKVVGCDSDTKIIENLQKNQPQIFEPGLEDAIKQGQADGTLSFTTDVSAVSKARFVYVALDTPVDKNDQVDLKSVEALFDSMIAHLSPESIVVISSQIPIGTSRKLLEKLRSSGKPNEICYVPENLRLGKALECFLNPDRTVFGVSSPKIKQSLEELFAVPGVKLFMNLESAEMTKHATNAYLASMISFSSEVSDLCERTGANALDVMNALKADNRVSKSAPILPGLSFGGGTLARDVQTLRSLGKQHSVPTRVMDGVMDLNTERMNYVPNRLRSVLGDLSGKTVVFLGLTYKPNTDTLKRSLALQIVDLLASSGATIKAYDPKIRGTIKSHPNVVVCNSPEEAVQQADALVITTAWDDFASLDYSNIAKNMRNPVLIDTTNRYASAVGTNLKYHGIGVSHE